MVNSIFEYFPDLDELQQKRFTALQKLYEKANDQVNLVSRKDIANIYTNHVLHSLALAKFCAFEPGQKVIDIGTGGGFPGIPLAILFPKTQFVLCDSIAKKIRVLQEIIDALELENAHATLARVEELPAKFDIAMARAVAPMVSLHTWMQNHWTGAPKYYLLKGGDLSDEITTLKLVNPKYKVALHNISDVFKEEFFETKKVVVIT